MAIRLTRPSVLLEDGRTLVHVRVSPGDDAEAMAACLSAAGAVFPDADGAKLYRPLPYELRAILPPGRFVQDG